MHLFLFQLHTYFLHRRNNHKLQGAIEVTLHCVVRDNESSHSETVLTHFQAMSGGAETMIDSIRPPSKPNRTPRSYRRLNSR
eukprot:scaffold90069_cov17-Tisochrysis_lutea.AAC.1